MPDGKAGRPAAASSTKSFVLDTNVLLHDPDSLYRVDEHRVVLSIAVIEEIDRFKKELTEVGRNARQVSRHLDQLRAAGTLTEGVPTPGGGTIEIRLGPPGPVELPFLEGSSSADMRILALARSLNDDGGDVVFITKDTNLRIKADVLGIRAEDYIELRERIEPRELGWREAEVPREIIDEMFDADGVDCERAGIGDPGPNVQILLRDAAEGSHTAPARRAPDRPRLRPVRPPRSVSGIRARNLEQRFALDLLLDPDVPLVCLLGKAGTGKTLLALAAGLHLTLDHGRYHRLLVARPIYPMGRDLGYLPGEVEEKLRPWMQPIFDNLDQLVFGRESGRGAPEFDAIEQLVEAGRLEIEALTYIRGPPLASQVTIVDEAQNLTPHEVKTVITRAGEGTKVVLTGDPDQIDNPYVDAASNGLSYASERTRGEALAGTVFLARGERSALAELAADRL